MNKCIQKLITNDSNPIIVYYAIRIFRVLMGNNSFDTAEKVQLVKLIFPLIVLPHLWIRQEVILLMCAVYDCTSIESVTIHE